MAESSGKSGIFKRLPKIFWVTQTFELLERAAYYSMTPILGYHVVYNLGYTLWPKGTSKPHGTRNGEPDSDGGYALRQYWV